MEKKANYRLIQFTGVEKDFERSGSVVKKPKTRHCAKRRTENLNDLKNKMEEVFLLSPRQAASNLSFNATTAWKMLRIDATTKHSLLRYKA